MVHAAVVEPFATRNKQTYRNENMPVCSPERRNAIISEVEQRKTRSRCMGPATDRLVNTKGVMPVLRQGYTETSRLPHRHLERTS
jgi:hypothetical protein